MAGSLQGQVLRRVSRQASPLAKLEQTEDLITRKGVQLVAMATSFFSLPHNLPWTKVQEASGETLLLQPVVVVTSTDTQFLGSNPSPTTSNCVALGNLPTLSDPHFLHLSNRGSQ